MNKLIINTVLPQLQIVLTKNEQIYTTVLDADKNHNEKLLGEIDMLLRKAELKMQDIDACLCFVGPGSFTGIRVGVATAKGFKDALGIKAYGINTLEYLSHLAMRENADAQVFALYGSLNSYFVAHIKDGKLVYESTNQTLDQLMNIANGRKIYVFSGSSHCEFAQGVDLNAEVLVSLADEVISRGDERLTPVYFQLSQAEAQKINRDVDISVANETDAKEITAIDNLIFEDKWSADAYSRECKNNKIFVAKLLDKIIGFIDLEIVADEMNIVKVGVLPDYRRNRVAIQLINHALEYAKQNNIASVGLEVSSNNIPAQNLYKKMGFESTRVRKQYYKDHSDGIEMRKQV